MSLEAEIRQALAALELVSQAPSTRVGSGGGHDASESIGGRRPPGGVDRRDDRAPDHPLKSVDHFRKRLRGLEQLRAKPLSAGVVERLILREINAATLAWKRQPPPPDRPPMSDPQWKRWAAESELSGAEISRLYGVSRQYVNRIRKLYYLSAP